MAAIKDKRMEQKNYGSLSTVDRIRYECVCIMHIARCECTSNEEEKLLTRISRNSHRSIFFLLRFGRSDNAGAALTLKKYLMWPLNMGCGLWNLQVRRRTWEWQHYLLLWRPWEMRRSCYKSCMHPTKWSLENESWRKREREQEQEDDESEPMKPKMCKCVRAHASIYRCRLCNLRGQISYAAVTHDIAVVSQQVLL